MGRRKAECADCGGVKEIRAHGLCSTCYSRRLYAGYRFDGPAPVVNTWGYTGPCVDCDRNDVERYIRKRCRRCYERWLKRDGTKLVRDLAANLRTPRRPCASPVAGLGPAIHRPRGQR